MDIVYNVESPLQQTAPKYGSVKVEGWIFSASGKNIKVYITLDDDRIIPSQKLIREDVRDAYPEEVKEYAYRSGFSHSIELKESEAEKPHTLRIIAQESDTGSETVLRVCEIQSIETYSQGLKSRAKLTWLYVSDYVRKRKYPKSIQDWKDGFRKTLNMFRYGNTAPVLNSKVVKDFADDYEIWRMKNSLGKEGLEIRKKKAESMPRILFTVVMPVYNTELAFLKEAVESVRKQIWSHWELCIADDRSTNPAIMKYLRSCAAKDARIKIFQTPQNSHISAASNLAAENATGEYLVMLDHDDLFVPETLFEIASVLLDDPDADMIYSDDDKISPSGELYDPQFKPDFSPELLLSYMYFGHVFAIRRSLFRKLGGFRIGFEGSQDHDLAVRAAEVSDRVIHIPKILYHWRATEGSTASGASNKQYSITSGMNAVREAVMRRGVPAEVYQPDFAVRGDLGIYALKYAGDYPLVSIVIPTKNHRGLLEKCIDSVEKKTTWPNYEILIVDDNSDETDAIQYLKESKHRVLSPHKSFDEFNFSWLVNRGVESARGEYIILLNNDTEVIEPQWIEYLMVYMRITGVGAVGAKLLYSDHLIQHAGVVLRMGNGIAGHAFKLLPESSGGYLSYAKTARNYSAVTAACMMTSKELFEAVHGFDEEDFARSYNDVDYCMRIRQLGKRIVYSPGALLYHHEGASRGTEQSGHYSDPEEEYRFFTKWIKKREFQDPYYNRNLSYEHEDFRINTENVILDDPHPLKILLVTHNLNYEGAPLVQYEVAKELCKKNYKFEVLSMEKGLLQEKYEELGIPVYTERLSEMRLALRENEFRSKLVSVSERWKDAGFEMIYANTVECFFGTALGEILSCPVLLSIHESIDFHTYFSGLGKDYQKEFARSLRKAVRVLFVSGATAKLYEELCTRNFSVIHNGIDLAEIETYRQGHDRQICRQSEGVNGNEFVVTVIGTVCERKGQILFARAAAILKEKNPDQKFVFRIVGAKPSPYLDLIQGYIEENGLTDMVRIYDYAPREKILEYYYTSDAIVCSSFEESSPLVILEAMAFGVPIISTNVFGIPELIRDGQDAILVPPNSSQAFADAVLKLSEEPELLNRFSKSAYYRVKTFFLKEQMIEQYDLLMQSVVQEKENRFCKANNL